MTKALHRDRNFTRIRHRLNEIGGDRCTRMRTVADTLWYELHETNVSWVGFYTANEGDAEMTLGPSRDTPACNPISMNGMCGRAFQSMRPVVVHDCQKVAGDVIFCDPRDRSELVIPLINDQGRPWGVLDLDSHDEGAFDDADVHHLHDLLLFVGLSWRGQALGQILRM